MVACRYCAPELRAVGNIDEKIDIYNLGIILNDLVSGCYVPVDELPDLRRAKVDDTNANEIRRIITACIDIDPNRRLTADQVEVGMNRLEQYVEHTVMQKSTLMT